MPARGRHGALERDPSRDSADAALLPERHHPDVGREGRRPPDLVPDRGDAVSTLSERVDP